MKHWLGEGDPGRKDPPIPLSGGVCVMPLFRPQSYGTSGKLITSIPQAVLEASSWLGPRAPFSQPDSPSGGF